ncbi:phage tail-collar fiber domain-containing protein [Desulfitobacterium sp. AusDCA]|uniref:phage tail-collar fiber domain-containing protein n=1 Tax=Desulfitobacterium sp. AusDCA TaxID=3240383 RepID=UPI003DA7240E
MGVNGFQGMVITQQGLNLLEKAQTGTQLQFTRVAVGDGNLSGQDPTLFTQLIDQIISLNISEINIGGSSNATISTVLSNEGLNTGFCWREIGIFAQDPDLGEILYCYNNLAGHEIFVPTVNTKQFKAPLEIEVFISNAVNVTAQIDPSFTYVPLTGATMVGPLILSGDPDQALGAATKQYVDNYLRPNATTSQPGIVEVSAAPTGVPVAVSTTDPAYTAVNGGTYVISGEGLTSTSQTNGQTLGVVFSTATPAAETEGNAGAAGTSTEAARADHVHPTPASYKPSAHESTHVTGGSDAIPVATETTDGLFSSTDKTKLDGITSGATNTPLSNVIPSAESAGTVGTAGNSVEAARADHVHSMPATYAPSAHASSHASGGADPITPVSIGAETPEGAQAKADSVQSNLNEHLADNVSHITADERTTWNAKQNVLGFTPLNKAGDTATGVIVAQNNTSYTTKQVRNITLSTASASGGSNGDIWFTYTA